MNKQTTILMYNKYSGSFCTILKLLFVSDQTYYLHFYYFRMTWRALTRYKSTVLSWFPCSIVCRRLLFRSIIYVMCMGHLSHDDHVSQSHFSILQGLVLRSWGYVLQFRCLSFGYLLCRRVTFVTCRDRDGSLVDSMILLFSEILILIGKYHVLFMYYDETIHNWRLWWLLSSVVCDILFKDINSCSVIWFPSMNSAGRLHFHVTCPACVLFWWSRSGTAMLFVNVFILFTIVNIAAEDPRVEHAKVCFTHVVYQWLIAAGSRLPLVGAIHS